MPDVEGDFPINFLISTYLHTYCMYRTKKLLMPLFYSLFLSLILSFFPFLSLPMRGGESLKPLKALQKSCLLCLGQLSIFLGERREAKERKTADLANFNDNRPLPPCPPPSFLEERDQRTRSRIGNISRFGYMPIHFNHNREMDGVVVYVACVSPREEA